MNIRFPPKKSALELEDIGPGYFVQFARKFYANDASITECRCKKHDPALAGAVVNKRVLSTIRR
jgi:hypothetical protein